jgi:hypothetical protein
VNPYELDWRPRICGLGTATVTATDDTAAWTAKVGSFGAEQRVVLIAARRHHEVGELAFVRDLPDGDWSSVSRQSFVGLEGRSKPLGKVAPGNAILSTCRRARKQDERNSEDKGKDVHEGLHEA